MCVCVSCVKGCGVKVCQGICESYVCVFCEERAVSRCFEDVAHCMF